MTTETEPAHGPTPRKLPVPDSIRAIQVSDVMLSLLVLALAALLLAASGEWPLTLDDTLPAALLLVAYAGLGLGIAAGLTTGHWFFQTAQVVWSVITVGGAAIPGVIGGLEERAPAFSFANVILGSIHAFLIVLLLLPSSRSFFKTARRRAASPPQAPRAS